MKKGLLCLIPAPLGDDGFNVISEEIKNRACSIEYFVVEDVRTARRFLRACGNKNEFSDGNFFLMDKKNPVVIDKKVFELLNKGTDVGLLSEAGLPCLADPGNHWVREAHRLGITVKPMSGPSSIFLALIASGFNGQQFRFCGYLPVKSSDRIIALKKLESISRANNETQIFIETPYRNNQMMDDILKSLSPTTQLCIAADLTLHNEFVRSQKISEWKKSNLDLHHRPTVFLIYVNPKQ